MASLHHGEHVWHVERGSFMPGYCALLRAALEAAQAVLEPPKEPSDGALLVERAT